MSRYETRLLRLQLAAEECATTEERHRILGEVAALREAYEDQLSEEASNN